MSVTAEVSATPAHLKLGHDLGIFGACAVSLPRRQVRVFHLQLHAFRQTLRPPAFEVGNSLGDVLHPENGAQTRVVAADQHHRTIRRPGSRIGDGRISRSYR